MNRLLIIPNAKIGSIAEHPHSLSPTAKCSKSKVSFQCERPTGRKRKGSSSTIFEWESLYILPECRHSRLFLWCQESAKESCTCLNDDAQAQRPVREIRPSRSHVLLHNPPEFMKIYPPWNIGSCLPRVPSKRFVASVRMLHDPPGIHPRACWRRQLERVLRQRSWPSWP